MPALNIHSGQHYDYNMSQAFAKDMGLPEPHVPLGVGSGMHGERRCRKLGMTDTNTSLATHLREFA